MLSNTTSAVVAFWQKPEAKYYKTEVLFVLTALLIGNVLILRAIRHRKAWALISFLLLAGGYLSTPALTYVLGLLDEKDIANPLTILWAVFLVVLDGAADNTVTLSLEDNEATRKRFLWDKMLPSLWLLWLIFSTLSVSAFWIPVILIWVLFVLKLREKKQALIYSCRSRIGLDHVASAVMDHMTGECTSVVETTTSMQDYKYLVGVNQALKQPASDNLATIDKIWKCEERLFGSEDTDGHLKDTCLSFALFWRLLPRFADYDLPKESTHTAWKFVNDVFLANRDDDSCERVFRVVEVELQFLRDYFYTNYFAIYRRGAGFLLVRAIVLALYLMISFITIKEISGLQDAYKSLGYSILYFKLELSISKIVIYALILVEVAHIISTMTCRWNKLKWVCNYVQNKWWKSKIGKVKEWLLCMLCHQPCFRPCFGPWHRKLRQYSLLDSYRHTPFTLRFKWVLSGYMELPMVGQKEQAPTSLSSHVMKAILLSLHTNGQKLSRGVKSLQQNNVEGLLSWACRNNEITRVILVWHIATSICEKEKDRKTSTGREDPDNFLVATSLSKYCAYLVAFVPKLLPDHVYTTQRIFQIAVSEAREELKPQDGKSRRLMKSIKKMIGCGGEVSILDQLVAGDSSLEQGANKGSLEQSDNIVKMGALLGEQLKGLKDESLRWKVLADFWAELILFLAPSKYANVHAQHLVTGGEFITHIWALLTHAGIVDRDGFGT